MSSRPDQQQQQQRGRRGGGDGGGGEEARGQSALQQLLSPIAIFVIGVILVGVGGFVWYQTQIIPLQDEQQGLEGQISTKQSELETKRKKANLREDAEALVQIVDGKIQDETGRFLKNQTHQQKFMNYLFNDIIEPSGMNPESISFDGFNYRFSYKSTPFDVVPRGIPWPGDDEPQFQVNYESEPADENRSLDNARPSQFEEFDPNTYIGELESMDPNELEESEEEHLQYFKRGIWNPRLGRNVNETFGKPDSFTRPWNFSMELRGSYEQMQNLIEGMHKASTYYFSVQCVTNDPGENNPTNFLRFTTLYTLSFSTYYMNEEASASGTAGALPGSQGC